MKTYLFPYFSHRHILMSERLNFFFTVASATLQISVIVV